MSDDAKERSEEPHPSSSNAALPPTDMLYYSYEGNFLTECESRVLDVVAEHHHSPKAGGGEDNNPTSSHRQARPVSVVLDQTVLHAQGGGQPTDVGTLSMLRIHNPEDADMEDVTLLMDVSKVTMDRSTGVARHSGTLHTIISTTSSNSSSSPDHKQNNTLDSLQIGDTVRVRVDAERRRLLSECHTAGHVVDSAVARVCHNNWKPAKGYHFLEGPYVEYVSSDSSGDLVVAPTEREALLQKLQTAFDELVQEDLETEIALLSQADADALCNRQAQNFDLDVFADPRTGTIRVVTVAGYPCPCGGTHVRSTGLLEEWGITGLKCKKGVVRVKYGMRRKAEGTNNNNK